MAELERMLRRLEAELDWPETPDLASTVSARLRAAAPAAPPGRPAPPTPPRPLARALRRPLAIGLRGSLALAAILTLVLAGAVMAAVPGVRHAVLDLFGLRGATVERRQTLPSPPPPRPLDLGSRTTLPEARGRLGFDPLVPADPGKPGAVYVRRDVPGGELSLTYGARPGLPRAAATRLGLLVSEFRGDLAPDYVGKLAGQGSTVERLAVDGRRAIWIEGAPHYFFYRAPGRRFVETELRLAQNVLLLERGRLLVRLEGAFDRDRAIAIARSLR